MNYCPLGHTENRYYLAQCTAKRRNRMTCVLSVLCRICCYCVVNDTEKKPSGVCASLTVSLAECF